MPILYEDKTVVCDDQALTIKQYFFPVGSRRILYSSIKGIQDKEMNLINGAWRIWGMGLSPHWFHLDTERPQKKRQIVLDLGELIKVVLTPEEHETVLGILERKTGLNPD
ncbi:hypothetical protein COW36_05890 [bacterium (Candidatus Blackallbacteria) CG17_big_fil_post_rev_8_21_14_2_50_48_46]|uniref:Bacterial Pleckstrin homology domain-containing protein n=1 Tax=bacterium (Candidatus Blackallbacteria) CG17_big_fil_post_rev_8_21_14_2_50_48_46 TaxID=2014261 RepID=A0A2M7G887_9BACT|nr:MAG: hypothetical protein COW64_21485 [bacterium (Candidatus Blackallbacteria) CG18_big_fil_WC_8_21_14_2_50_49_26]PIW18297.1 MAG: hypothetical protein COW36_05890 [bacterium (Candidatus Blackallbacteria) CG17_big_fil_post_rev_8_21_14_2_50_48_46]PIW49521.1 MAG: hypothetical protein COW20_05705 [bacterium (Candidatus Blackallbacteria) CG13_big_fil_rev_8_21_14_2_50_49_14]